MQSEQTFLNPFATAQTTSTSTKIQLKIEIISPAFYLPPKRLVEVKCCFQAVDWTITVSLNTWTISRPQLLFSSIFLNSMNYADP